MPGAEAVLAGTVAQPRHLAVPALLAPAGESGLARDKVAGYHWPDDEEDRARLASTRLYRLCGRTSARTTSSAAPFRRGQQRPTRPPRSAPRAGARLATPALPPLRRFFVETRPELSSRAMSDAPDQRWLEALLVLDRRYGEWNRSRL